MRLLEHRVAYPRTRRYVTPLLLLHGAWHGAWCWQEAIYHADLVIIPAAAHDLMLDPDWPLAADSIERAVARWESS